MKLEGAMTAVVTPFKNGEVDYQALSRLIDEQIEAGIDAVVAVGTTGESATLSMREHVEVIQHFIKAARGRVPVVAGAGANSTREALELTRASEEAGAEALLHVVPYYNKPTQEGLFQHFKTVAEATKLPVILYNVPGRTSCDLQPETVERLCAVDNIVAIKEATGNTVRACKIRARCGDRMTILSGDDFTSFPLYAVGARGVISVVANVMPHKMAEMFDAVDAGDWDRARQLHYDILPLTDLCFAEANPIPVKEALHILGKCEPDVRLPLVRCTEPVRERIRQRLKDEGLL